MSQRKVVIYGMCADRPHAESAVKSLTEAGFPQPDVAVLLPQNHELAAVSRVSARAGYVTAGPVKEVGRGKWSPEALFEALLALRIPEGEARSYQDEMERGGVLLAVYPVDSASAGRARTILERVGAAHITSAERVPADDSRSRKPAWEVDAGEEWDH